MYMLPPSHMATTGLAWLLRLLLPWLQPLTATHCRLPSSLPSHAHWPSSQARPPAHCPDPPRARLTPRPTAAPTHLTTITTTGHARLSPTTVACACAAHPSGFSPAHGPSAITMVVWFTGIAVRR